MKMKLVLVAITFLAACEKSPEKEAPEICELGSPYDGAQFENWQKARQEAECEKYEKKIR